MASIGGRKKGTSRRWGVVIDGNTAHGVALDNGVVVDRQSVTSDTPIGALSAWWAAANPVGEVTVAWAAEGLQGGRTEIPAVPEEALRAAIEGVAADTYGFQGEKISAAAKLIPASDGTEAVLYTLPDRELSSLWKKNYASDVALTTLGMALEEDGVWIYAGTHGAQIDVVVDGVPVLHRRLHNIEGTHDIAEALVDNGPMRLKSVVDGMGDPKAVGAVNEWSDRFANEVRLTLDFWARSNTIPAKDAAYVYGPGAVFPSLHAALARLSVPTQYPAEIRPLATRFASDADAAEWAAPIAVAAFSPDDLGRFSNPAAAIAAKEAEKRAAQAKRLTRVLAVAAGVVVITALPIVHANMELSSAESALSDAEEELDGLSEELAVAQFNKRMTTAARSEVSAEPQWSDVLSRLWSTKPDNVAISDLGVAYDGTDIVVSLSGTGEPAPFRDLSLWLRTAAEEMGGENVFAESASYSPDKISFSAGFTVPACVPVDEDEELEDDEGCTITDGSTSRQGKRNFGEPRTLDIDMLIGIVDPSKVPTTTTTTTVIPGTGRDEDSTETQADDDTTPTSEPGSAGSGSDILLDEDGNPVTTTTAAQE